MYKDIIKTIDFGLVAILIFLGMIFVITIGEDAINWLKRLFRGLLSRKGKNDKGRNIKGKKQNISKGRRTK